MVVTGFRHGELCALRWHDLGLVNGVLSVQRAGTELNGRTWEKDTKTHQQRRITLDPQTLALLKTYHARRVELVGMDLAKEVSCRQTCWSRRS